jgi:hypothetical protein
MRRRSHSSRLGKLPRRDNCLIDSMRDFHCFARSHKDNSQSLLWFRMDPKRDASAKTSLANSERCRAISASPPSVETNSHHGTTWRATFILQRASEYTARRISCSNVALRPPPAHALKIGSAIRRLLAIQRSSLLSPLAAIACRVERARNAESPRDAPNPGGLSRWWGSHTCPKSRQDMVVRLLRMTDCPREPSTDLRSGSSARVARVPGRPRSMS